MLRKLGFSTPHNPEVVGSSPASATRSSSRNGFRYDYFFILVRYIHSKHYNSRVRVTTDL